MRADGYRQEMGTAGRRKMAIDSSGPGCYEYGVIERLDSRSSSPRIIFENH
jgi:hypothetical protein